MAFTEDPADFIDQTDFAVAMRWIDENTVEHFLNGIINHDVQFYGDFQSASYQGSTVTVARIDMPRHKHGDELLDIDNATTYKLQNVVKDDGVLRIIEITK